MISNAIDYSEQEKKTIEKIMGCPKFSGQSWELEEARELAQSIKKQYILKQNTICPYCRRKLCTENGRDWDIEHIVPRATHPQFMFEPLNLCVACVECNKHKSDKKVTNSTAQYKYPKKTNQFFIVHPHFDVYENHITVIEAGVFYMPTKDDIDFKSKGQRTIEICGLNRFLKYAGYDDYDIDICQQIDDLNYAASTARDSRSKQVFLKQILMATMKSIRST
ncbi:HNH endonuclease [Vibrio harveyi]|uniref:HNH endonuclease n=1 Tax=Vibrio harveyi TaxID=669 RepID=UPI00288EA769|nr:HNH endonuclease [Vibrio harveyi]ELH4834946.1 HNH endonuclease [Vibrio harveyi]